MSRKERRQPERDEDAVHRFVERFASVMVDSGLPRMPARVFAALLVSDDGRLTAAELGERLQVSPAAVSGAMRYLIQASLASKERQPGSRRDVYRVHDDVWYEASLRRDQMLHRWKSTLEDGIDVVGRGTPAGRRLVETHAFVDFYLDELPELLTRWRRRRTELRSEQ